MKFMQEVTQWQDGSKNGMYVFNDIMDSILAFCPSGKTEFKVFKQPIKIFTTGRKFVPVEPIDIPDLLEPNNSIKRHTVVGSKGEIYTVVDDGNKKKCSCAGFKFRGHCKHLDMV